MKTEDVIKPERTVEPFNSMAVVRVEKFNGTTTQDKNGKDPVILVVVGGVIPKRHVLSGTLAERAGLIVGKTYLVQCRKRGFDVVYGDDYVFSVLQEITKALDIVETARSLGDPILFDVERPAGANETIVRKSNAVESEQTKRAKQGYYIPVSSTHLDHRSASEIIKGRSQLEDNLTPKHLRENAKNSPGEKGNKPETKE